MPAARMMAAPGERGKGVLPGGRAGFPQQAEFPVLDGQQQRLDLVFAVKRHIEKEFSLEEHPLLIVGESSGGSMAQQMAVAYPEKIAAAAWIGGGRYMPFEQPMDAAFLALNNWGCHGLQNTRRMVEDAASKGITVLHAQSLPLLFTLGAHNSHGPADSTYRLLQAFLEGAVELENSNEGKVPHPSQWPVATEDGARLPSEAFAQLWRLLPHEAIQRIDNGDKGVIVFPPPDDPEALVVMVARGGGDGSIQLKDGLYTLTQHHAVAVALLAGGLPGEAIPRLSFLIDEVSRKEEWKDLPVVLYGNGLAGQLAAVAGLRSADPRIAKIVTLDADLRSPFPELSVADEPNPANIPVEMHFTGPAVPEAPERSDIAVSRLADMNRDQAQFHLLREITRVHLSRP